MMVQYVFGKLRVGHSIQSFLNSSKCRVGGCKNCDRRVFRNQLIRSRLNNCIQKGIVVACFSYGRKVSTRSIVCDSLYQNPINPMQHSIISHYVNFDDWNAVDSCCRTIGGIVIADINGHSSRRHRLVATNPRHEFKWNTLNGDYVLLNEFLVNDSVRSSLKGGKRVVCWPENSNGSQLTNQVIHFGLSDSIQKRFIFASLNNWRKVGTRSVIGITFE
mmetsp:Transcript_19878/g.48801  ORF Transcript_19878/g.48801 Transcript_19878/m.48801 type:complete len:218 (+) Transcript_19878:495-1148(+)